MSDWEEWPTKTLKSLVVLDKLEEYLESNPITLVILAKLFKTQITISLHSSSLPCASGKVQSHKNIKVCRLLSKYLCYCPIVLIRVNKNDIKLQKNKSSD